MKNKPSPDEILAKLFGSVSRARIIELLVSLKRAYVTVAESLHFLVAKGASELI